MPPQPRKPKKPAPKPGDGLLGWFGRQVGHVKKAVQVDVTKPPSTAKPSANSGPKPVRPGSQQAARPGSPQADATGSPQAAAQQEVVYRTDTVEEVDHPTQPGVKLRRTTIDEVVVEKKIGTTGESGP